MDNIWYIIVIFTWISANHGLKLHVLTPPEKKIGCALPELTSGVLFQTNHEGNRVFYRCDRGYSTLGNVFSICEDGLWSSLPPICIAGGCRKMYHIEHGRVVLGYGGAMATFSCKEGYEMKGSKVLVCDGEMWNATIPICTDDIDGRGGGISYSHSKHHRKTHSDWLLEADYSCIKRTASVRPPPIHHALATTQWAVIEGKPRLYTLYRCMWGYVPKSKTNKLYCKDGEWTGAMPKCILAVTTPVPEIPSDQAGPEQTTHTDWLRLSDYTCMGSAKLPQQIKPKPAHNGHYALRHDVVDGTPRLYAELRCNDGYQLRDDQVNVYCKERAWFGPEPKCVKDGHGDKRSCGDDNGGCQHDCNTEDGHVVCSCNLGYLLADNRHSCLDTNECVDDNGGCEHVCRNSPGSYSCYCYVGHQLSDDGHSCQPSYQSESNEMKPPMALFHR